MPMRPSRRKWWPGVAIGALVLATAAGCHTDTDTPVASAFMQSISGPVVFGMTAYMTSTGVRSGKVEADTAYTYADSTDVDLRGMHVIFYDDDGNERATVTARSGEWNENTDRMIAHGDVVLIVDADSSKIESQEINYDPDSDRVWSDSATVRTLKDGSVTRGSSFESDIDFNNVVVRNPRGGVQRVF
jgi:LPS export ABC transporter protein LptC